MGRVAWQSDYQIPMIYWLVIVYFRLLHSVDPCLYFREIPDGGECLCPNGILLVGVIHCLCVMGDPVQLVPTSLSSR